MEPFCVKESRGLVGGREFATEIQKTSHDMPADLFLEQKLHVGVGIAS